MKRLLSVLFILIAITYSIFAAETENEIQSPDDDFEYVYKQNQSGDSFIRMSLAVDIPVKPDTSKMFVGGSGTLGFYRLLTSWFAIGGDFSFAYSETVGSNVYYFIPVMARPVFQLAIGRFEIPVTLGLGMSFQNYVDRLYCGLTLNPEIGFFYRWKTEWSAGAILGTYIMPQWFENSAYNYTGIVVTAGLTVRYHF